MQVKTSYWHVVTPYDGAQEGFWDSRNRIKSAFLDLGGTGLKWNFSSSIPKNWVGYTVENPSPGHAISTHRWEVDNEESAMLLLMVGGFIIEKREKPSD